MGGGLLSVYSLLALWPSGVDLAVYGAMRPQISGLDPRVDEIGRVAVDTLVAQLHRHEYGLPEHPLLTMIEGS